MVGTPRLRRSAALGTTRVVRRLALAASVVGVLALVAGGGGVASAAAPAKKRTVVRTGTALPDMDKRFGASFHSRSAEQAAALRALGNVEISWNEVGTPHSLRARKGFLTTSSSSAPDAVARAFVRENAALFRQQPDDVANLELTMNHRDRSGATFLRYKQTFEGRDVHGSSLLFVLDAQRRILSVGGLLAPSLRPMQAPSIDARAAVARVAASVSPRRLPPIALGSTEQGVTTFRNTLALPKLRKAAPVKADLVTVPTAMGGRLAWRVRAEVASNADYESLVDAQSGELIYRDNGWSTSEPHGLVHTSDDPETGDQVANVPFSGLDGSWVDDDTTSGNNVNAYQDAAGDNSAEAADQPHDADRHWTTPGTTRGAPASPAPRPTCRSTGADRDAVVTQLFYYTNWYHDYAYDLGFTETARNFQNDNFGHGGTGGDAVEAESDANFTRRAVPRRPTARRSSASTTPTSTPTAPTGPSRGCRCTSATPTPAGRHGVRSGPTTATRSSTSTRTASAAGSSPTATSRAASSPARSVRAGATRSRRRSTTTRSTASTTTATTPTASAGLPTTTTRSSTAIFDDGTSEHNNGRIWAMNMWEVRAALIAKYGVRDRQGQARAADDARASRARRTRPASTTPAPATWSPTPSEPPPARGCRANWCRSVDRFADNELGVTAGSDPTRQRRQPHRQHRHAGECDPGAAIAPAATDPRAATSPSTAPASTIGGDAGDTLAYAWDLDNDGDFDDSTRPDPVVGVRRQRQPARSGSR